MISLISLAIVGIIILFWFWKLFQFVIVRPIQIQRLSTLKGTYKDGKITSSNAEIGSSNKSKKTQIEVAFTNFSGTPITHNFKFTDTQPKLNRYLKGNRLSLILTDNFNQPVMIDGSKMSVNYIIRFIHFLVLGGYIYGVITLFQYMLPIIESSPNGIYAVTSNFLVALLGGIYFFVLLLIYFVFRAVGLIGSDKTARKNHKLKFYGEKAMATITSANATGTRVNNNPVVKFNYTFESKFGNVISGSDKLLVNQLEAGSVSSISEREVLYLNDNPEVNTLVQSVNKPMFGGCVKYIFLFLAFVFSCVVLGIFIGSTFF